MGWGIVYEGYISKVTLSELDGVIEESGNYIRRIDDELLALACMTHGKNEDGLEPHEWVPHKVRELLEERDDAVIKLAKCREARTDESAKDT